MTRPWQLVPGTYQPETLGLSGSALQHDRIVQVLVHELHHRGQRCVCRHTELVHRHQRPGSRCGLCDCPGYRRPLRHDLAAVIDHTRRHLVPDIVRRWKRRLHNLVRFIDCLEFPMAADRDLITTILAALPAIAEGVAAKDAKIASLTEQLTAAGVAAAADETADAAALAPVADAVAALRTALADSPTTPTVEPDPIPVEDIPAAVEEAAATEPTDPGPLPDPTS